MTSRTLVRYDITLTMGEGEGGGILIFTMEERSR